MAARCYLRIRRLLHAQEMELQPTLEPVLWKWAGKNHNDCYRDEFGHIDRGRDQR